MNNVIKLKSPAGQAGNSLLGFTLDGSRLEGVSLRRAGDSVEVRKTFSFALSLDPLTGDPELVGREIQKQLESAGVRERRCVVCVPLGWALTLTTKLPDLPEADIDSFLQLESERGFPQGTDALMLAQSRWKTPGGEAHATLVAIPRDHIARLEAVFKAARLRSVSFSLGITALQRPDEPGSNGVLALAPGETSVGLQVSCGGGLAVLRTVEGNFDQQGGGQQQLQAEQVARETRITLGQLPPDVRDAVKRLRVFGRSATADQLAEQLRVRVEPLGIRVESVRDYSPSEFGVRIPAGTAVTPAVSLALRCLAGQGVAFEFLPPKISKWKQIKDRYAGGRMATAGIAASAVAVVVAVAFLVQQAIIWHWQNKWNVMSAPVGELDKKQAKLNRYGPWADHSFRSLSVLKRLTEAFPLNGTVTAKTIEIREAAENQKPVTIITCTGTTQDGNLLLTTLRTLSAAKEVSGVHLDNLKGTPPNMEFSFNFHWKK